MRAESLVTKLKVLICADGKDVVQAERIVDA
jgi:hypothetical protein